MWSLRNRLLSRRRASATDPPASERLDSWKEIAVYLRRSVRTVQRWEEAEELPVHRHLHDTGGSVYAYRAELDAWWTNRGPRLEAAEPHETPAQPARHPSLKLILLGLLLLGLGAVTVWWVARPPPRPAERSPETPSLAFDRLDWVLIPSFENRTGDPLFDGTLEYALERELSNSQHVRAVPRERIQDALRLMRKAADSPIDSHLGREICLRDGNIGALLTGRIESTGSRYLLSVAVSEPATGVAASTLTEVADGKDEVIPAVQRIAARVREELGEGLPSIVQSREKLERVTTPSLRALQLYTKADALIARFESGVAEELLRQAIAEDPEFASAHILLAWAIRNQPDRSEEEYLPIAERAWALAEGATTVERYFIQGSYHTMQGEEEKELAAYKALLSLAPDHFWATNNLEAALFGLGRPEEAVPYVVRRAESLPLSYQANREAVWALLVWAGDLARAEPFYRRLAELETAEDIRQDPGWVMNLRFLPIYRSWLDGDLESALNGSAVLAESLEPEFGLRREAGTVTGSWCFATFYATLGRLAAAAEQIRDLSDSFLFLRPEALARIAFLRGDLDAARAHLEGALGHLQVQPETLTAILLARVGLPTEAEGRIAVFEAKPYDRPGYVEVARGEVALARGKIEEARVLLEEGTEQINFLGPTYFLALESLAHLLRQRGDLESAVRVLEPTYRAGVRARAAFLQAGPFWLRNRLQLAGLYEELGKDDQARQIEEELSALLAHADPDHPLLAALESGDPVPMSIESSIESPDPGG